MHLQSNLNWLELIIKQFAKNLCSDNLIKIQFSLNPSFKIFIIQRKILRPKHKPNLCLFIISFPQFAKENMRKRLRKREREREKGEREKGREGEIKSFWHRTNIFFIFLFLSLSLSPGSLAKANNEKWQFIIFLFCFEKKFRRAF